MTQDHLGINRRDPERVRADILRAATTAFVDHGFAGARIDEIARQTQTTKRMIYYYFESKDALFRAVINATFEEFWHEEQQLQVPVDDPIGALRIWSEYRFTHYAQHGDLLRLCATEDSRVADYICPSVTAFEAVSPRNDLLSQILQRGVAAGVFRSDMDALEVGILSASYAAFHSVFRGTVLTLYSRDMLDSERVDHARRIAGDMMVATLTAMPDHP